MKLLPFAEFFEKYRCILGEGAVIERLRRNSEIDLDPHIVNSAFVYDKGNGAALAGIYRQYLDIGRKYNLPLVLSTPTWRASHERIEKAGYAKMDVNADNFRFLDAIRKSYGEYAGKIVISGLLSCRGDAYNQSEALTANDAHGFHTWQLSHDSRRSTTYPRWRHRKLQLPINPRDLRKTRGFQQAARPVAGVGLGCLGGPGRGEKITRGALPGTGGLADVAGRTGGVGPRKPSLDSSRQCARYPA